MRKLELEGESLTRPPKGFDRNHPLIEVEAEDFMTGQTISVNGGWYMT